MKQPFIYALAILLLVPNFNTHAQEEEERSDFFVEPTLIYTWSQTALNLPLPYAASTGTMDGWGFALRGALRFPPVVFAGIDLRISQLSFRDLTNGLESVAMAWQVGPMIGFDWKDQKVRGWVSAVVAGDTDPLETQTLDLKFIGATGYRLGVAYHLDPVDISVEYEGMGYRTTQGNRNLDYKDVRLTLGAWTVGFSWPLDFNLPKPANAGGLPKNEDLNL